MLIISTTKDGRTCKKLINALLKSKTAKSIKRLNYVKNYKLSEDKKTIIKNEEKILMINFDDDKKNKIIMFCNKQLGKGNWDITKQ